MSIKNYGVIWSILFLTIKKYKLAYLIWSRQI